jgi:cell division septum initiation protein DivIVA
LEQARHQATELTNATRAEVEQTLEWARGQAGAIISRAQEGAEQLLGAAGLGDEAIDRVATSIVSAAQAAAESSRGTGASAATSGPRLREPEEAEAEPEAEPESQPEEEPPLSPPVSPGSSPPAAQNEDDTTG